MKKRCAIALSDYIGQGYCTWIPVGHLSIFCKIIWCR